VRYELLLPSQIMIVAVMARISLDFTRGRGFFFDRRALASPALAPMTRIG
jgi:hypothetical protein